MPFLDYSNRLRQWVPALSPPQAEDFINQAWRDIREANDQWSFLLDTEYWLAPPSINLSGLTVTQFSATVILTYATIQQIANLNNPPITQRQLRFSLSGGPIYSISASDVNQLSDGAITAATTTLTSTSGPFSTDDIGKLIVVEGAGPGGGELQTTISAYISPTQVTLALAASVTVGPTATFTYGSALTLDRVYNETTNTSQSALLYRVYYSPLSTNFQRIDHMIDPITGYEFGWEVWPIDALDRMDPQRAAVTQPYEVFLHHFDSVTGLPVFELWPGPTTLRAYVVTLWRLGEDFSDDDDALPPQITEELLMTRARMLAYEWGASATPDPRLRQSYFSLMSYARSRYSTEGQPGRPLGLLDQSIRRDEEIALKQGRMRPRRPGPGWPVDSNFAQAHAIPPWWGGSY